MILTHIPDLHQATRVADMAVATSGSLAVSSWLVQTHEVLAIMASIVAIGAGIIAAMFHYEKWKALRSTRKGEK